jgi:hypothetical protein
VGYGGRMMIHWLKEMFRYFTKKKNGYQIYFNPNGMKFKRFG